MAYPGDSFARTKTFEKEIASLLNERGIEGLNEYVSNEFVKWKDIEINKAVTGNSGTGKFAFINAIRGLHPTDQQDAAEEVTECTQRPTPYSHPRNPRFVLWDLRGIGTPARKKSSYVDDMQFRR
ncbi:interferon-inducible GTPase 1-like [Mercenaria mercenaria]|uniref:interferon-inducible GTPase 1-like n=1 Tax=Mercenaria mercenaria TaxID=6596 RepID=UPI00234F69F7|nr:interferon-inducible GTPase 1-like [Mercenaria mercenaria]